MIQEFLICKAHYIERSEKRLKEKISFKSWHRHFIMCFHVIILDITWIIKSLHFVILRFRAFIDNARTTRYVLNENKSFLLKEDVFIQFI
jgi:hypothetical protein